MRCCLLTSATVGLLCATVAAQAPSSPSAASHVAAARAAARQDHLAMFNNVCSPPPTPQSIAPVTAAPPAAPPRSEWYAEPVKVFDNLYWVGQTRYTAWAVITSAGIIVIDPLFDYSVDDAVVGGLRKLEANPSQIEYVLISHAHRDHVAGARHLQERFGARVVMSEADWDLLATDPGSWPKPTRDVVATDGYQLTLGDTTLTLHLTPGHTLGTISTIIPVKDGPGLHTAALWGGTSFNWRRGSPRYITADRPASFWYEAYAASARKFREVATKVNADVLLSNHPQYDGSTTKLALVGQREPGQPHPYVVGNDSVSRFLTVAEKCALAGPLW